jgi:anti-sigma factor RsiW
MTCEQTEELIGPYVDDDLPSEARRRVESHLLRCTGCAWQAQTQRITSERLREHAAGEVVTSDAFRARALTRLREDNPHLTAPTEEATDPAQYRLPIEI